MATTLGSIIVELLAKTGSFDTDIDRSTKQAEKRVKDMTQAIKASFAGNLLADFAHDFIGRLASLPGTVLHSVDALNDVADATGSTIEKLSALEDIGARTGTSMDSVSQVVAKFNAFLRDTDPDGKTARALAQIGLNADELRKMDPSDALHATALALAKYADDGDKARLVTEILGRSSLRLAAFLKDLADKTELVGTVTTEQAKEAEAFNQQLAQMQKNSADAARSFMAQLLPAINAAAKAWKESGLVEGLKVLFTGTDVHKANAEIVRLTDEILTTQNKIDAARAKKKEGGVGGFLADMNLPTYEKYLTRLQEQLRSAQALITVSDPNFLKGPGATDENKPSVGPLARKPKKEPKERKGKDEDADFKQYMNHLEQEIQKVDELTTVQKLNDDIRRGHLTVSEDQKAQLTVLAKIVDKEKEWHLTMKEGRERAMAEGDAVQKANEAYQERLKTLLAATPTSQTEQLRADLQQLQDEFSREGSELSKNPKLFKEAWDAAIAGASKPLAQFNLQLSDTQQFALDAGQAGLSALERMAIEGGNLNDVFKNLAQSIAHMIFQIGVMEPAMRMMREAITGGVTPPNPFKSDFGIGGFGGGGFDLGGILSSIGSSLFGGFSLPFGGGRAAGGPVMPGYEYDVGELGREKFRPSTYGTVFPAGASGDPLAAGVKINNYGAPITSARYDPRERALILNEARRMVAADASDPSSSLSQSLQRSTNLRPRRF